MPTETARFAPRRIVIASFGSLGDLHPFLALAMELARRGHTITIAGAPYYAERITALGLTFEPLGPPISPVDPDLLHRLMRTARGPMYLFRTLFLPHLPQLYADLVRLTTGADLLIASEVVFAAPIIGEKTGLPWVSVLLSPGSFHSAYDPSILPPLARFPAMRSMPPAFHRGMLRLVSLVTRRWTKPIQDFRRELGLPPAASLLLRGKLSAGLVLAMFSRHFAAAQPDWPPQARQTGFAFFDQNALYGATIRTTPEDHQHTIELLRAFLNAGARPVVFTLGSAAVHAAGDFFHISAGATHRLGIRAVLISPRPDVALLAAPNILVIPYADYRTLFPHAAAIVHQAGIGTMGEVLRSGIPSLIVPFNFDQPDNAARAVRLGIAITLPRRKYNRRHSYYALHRLLRDGDLRERAAAMGERIRAEDGACTAVNAIEAFLANVPPHTKKEE